MKAAALAIALLAISATANAEARKLTGPEIAEALTGNTVYGMWGATEYRSYFDAGGATIDAPKGRQPDTGSWRVRDDRYCSVWAMSGESCYDIYRDGDHIIWGVPEAAKRYDSVLIPGRALAF